ncbi:MAG: type III-B CRISPR module-associated protein Cmr5, partial [Armatimonadota bacterium]|nr:type III-B CRISPR module-associated protein Cmr5 [Armatimonadota bacterium]
RSQRLMGLALKLVQEVAEQYSDKDHPVRRIYGGLCHNFPVLVRTCGLCQAVAFSVDKAGAADSNSNDEKDRAKAHHLHLQHIARVLADSCDESISTDNLLDRILGASLEEYIRYTRQVLAAWVYFRRFARSILKVEPGGERQ